MIDLVTDDFEKIVQRCLYYCADETFAENLGNLRKIVQELDRGTYVAPPAPISFNPASSGHVPDRGYVIGYIPRSGSTLLAVTLTNLTYKGFACLGYPGEIFNLDQIPARARHYGCRSLDDYARWALWESTDESGLFAVKGDLFQLLPFLFVPTFQRLMANIKFVYLTREDVLLQAISLVIAHHTGRWTSESAVDGTFSGDVDEIAANVRMLTQMMASWETVFAFSGVRPLRLTYEELEANVNACVRKIASHVDVLLPPGGFDAEVTLMPTRNENNYEMARRAIARLGVTSTVL